MKAGQHCSPGNQNPVNLIQRLRNVHVREGHIADHTVEAAIGEGQPFPRRTDEVPMRKAGARQPECCNIDVDPNNLPDRREVEFLGGQTLTATEVEDFHDMCSSRPNKSKVTKLVRSKGAESWRERYRSEE